MKNRIATVILLIFLAIAVGFFAGWLTPRSDAQKATSLADAPGTALAIQRPVRRFPPSASKEPQKNSGQENLSDRSPREAYLLSAKCVGVTAESQIALQKEISDLEKGVEHVDSSLRESFNHEIRDKKETLNARIACLSSGAPTTQDQVRKLLRAAAQSGDVASQLEYARDPLIDPLQSISHIDDLRQWRQLSKSYVASAAEAGNVDAMLLKAEAADPFRCQASGNELCAGLFANIVEESPLVAYENYYLAGLFNPQQVPSWVAEELAALRTLMSDADVLNAEKSAKTKYERLANR